MTDDLFGWMICLVHLQCALDALHQTKEYGQSDYYNYLKPKFRPKSVPLNRIPSIRPQLTYGLRTCFVERLLQHDQSIVPEREVANLAVSGI
jgi:hypothetical protein